MGSATVFVVAGVLLLASVAGKLIGVFVAGKILKWPAGEASIIGWLLQTKALIMIIFTNLLVGQAYHHQRNLHRFIVDGGRQHHAHDASRASAAQVYAH